MSVGRRSGTKVMLASHTLHKEWLNIYIFKEFLYWTSKRKRKRSDSVLWQNPLHSTENKIKAKWQQKMSPKFSITRQLRTDSWTVRWNNDSHPTSVVNLFSDWEGKGPCTIVPLTWKIAHQSLWRMIRNGPLDISKSLKKAEYCLFAKISSQSLPVLCQIK